MAKKDKSEIRTYYETHYDEVKDVAEKFGTAQRTLYDWIKKEGWQMGKFAKTGADVIKTELVQTAIASKLDYAKQSVINEIKGGFEAQNTPYSDEIIETRADELLIEALGINYINKSMAQAAVIAKANLKEMVKQNAKPGAVISASKDVVNIFSELKRSIHGKEPNTIVQIANYNGGALSANDMAALSDEELNALISEAAKDE